jgi:membrane protease YdiL (CAAX protease family)
MSVDAEVGVVTVAPLPVNDSAAVTPKFGAGKAILAFVVLLGAQFVAGVAVMVVAVVMAVFRGRDFSDPKLIGQLTSSTTAALLLVSGAASALAALLVARLWAWELVRDTTEAGLGLKRTSMSHVLRASAVGITLAVAYLSVMTWVVPYHASEPLGPLAAAATGAPFDRFAFAVLALLFAPFVEEFFFRGLLLKGFSTSWGPRVGAIVVTTLFILLHLTETFDYWPATTAVALMSVGALLARTITGSLGPAVALHGSYNFVIVLVVVLSPYGA